MRQYNNYLTQASNMKNFDLNGKMEYLTPYEIALELSKEIQQMKEEDKL